jgi:hypothetical protein
VGEKAGQDAEQNEYLQKLQARLQLDEQFSTRSLEAVDDTQRQGLQRFQRNYLELLDQQRTPLHEMNHQADFDEDIIRKYLALLDLEEYELRKNQPQQSE